VASRKDALLLPADALRREEGRSVVLAPSPEGRRRPETVEVEVGLTDGKRVEILSGLEEGDAALVRSFRLPRAAAAGKNPFSPFGGRGMGGGRSGQGGRGEGSGGGAALGASSVSHQPRRNGSSTCASFGLRFAMAPSRH